MKEALTEPMRHAREVALSILKPSRRDLEYGLGLHREALVIESYSLGLHAPPDADALNEATATGASDLEYQDLYEEQIMTRWAAEEALKEEYLSSWEAAGVDCIFLNAGEEGNDPLRLLKRLARYVFLTDAMPGVVRRAVSAEAIEANRQSGHRSLCFALNGIPLSGRLESVEDELRHVRVFSQLGAGMMHLTYNRRNPVGDGCGELADGGLSDFGRATVAELNRLGVIIDVAHTGWRTTLDVAKATRQPVVISHSAVWELNRHVRCKPDPVIRAVVETGGAMGLTTLPRFLGGAGDLSVFLDHIDYVVKHFGADAVTIGTDLGHRSQRHAAAMARVLPRPPRRRRWEVLWPEGEDPDAAEWNQPQQLQSMAWTNWPLFTVGMVQRGHDDAAIRKIVGGNMLRIAREAWKTRPAGRPL